MRRFRERIVLLRLAQAAVARKPNPSTAASCSPPRKKVRGIHRRRFHRDENIVLAKRRFGDGLEFDDI
jgi:hypothetical protein